MTTLLVLYRRPDGGAEAQAIFERRYAAEHRVTEAIGGETDLILAASMRFDDRAALDAGLASDSMRQAGRNLREIAPGLATFLVVEDVPEMVAAASPSVDTVGSAVEDRP